VLSEAVYDPPDARLAPALVRGAPVTPLPLLAYGGYPPLRLPELAPPVPVKKKGRKTRPLPEPPAGGGLPGASGGAPLPGVKGAAPSAQALKWVPLDDLEAGPALLEQLQARFKGGVYPFDPSGLPPDSPNAGKAVAPPASGTGPKGRPAAGKQVPDRCLVRFFDAGVEPGKTYVYAVQLRLANPNHGKPDVVAYKQLADVKELPAPWAFTPPVTVPGEWDFYVADQRALEQFNKAWAPARGSDVKPASRTAVAVQVHKWFARFTDPADLTRGLGDWLVLERALLHRGESVGRANVPADVPDWSEALGRFQLLAVGAGKGKRAGRGLDFGPGRGEPPTVVDFTGGHGLGYRVTPLRSVTDDAAAEVLLLYPDGKLRLRSGRVDSDPDTARGRARLARYEAWRARLTAVWREAVTAGQKSRPR
jgi:hypothetical protein